MEETTCTWDNNMKVDLKGTECELQYGSDYKPVAGSCEL
jgi:hypothetical protein